MAKEKAKPIVKNTENPRCVICNVSDLSVMDTDVFYRKVAYRDFLEVANKEGYIITEKDFEAHRNKHLYIEKPTDGAPPAIESKEALDDMINALRTQLRYLESSHDTDTPEYTKKMDLIKSLLELKGRFDGQFTQKVEVTNDFRTLMLQRLTDSPIQPQTTASTVIDVPVKRIQPKPSRPPAAADITQDIANALQEQSGGASTSGAAASGAQG
jgi:hypothetical protein